MGFHTNERPTIYLNYIETVLSEYLHCGFQEMFSNSYAVPTSHHQQESLHSALDTQASNPHHIAQLVQNEIDKRPKVIRPVNSVLAKPPACHVMA
jgi:hypothetical protein